MVCDEAIGWRNDTRKVIVFTTDQSFHIAMDGKLGGLVYPNDGLCHLNTSGFYTYSTVQDYPSIGHINHLVKEKKVSVIWAVTSEKLNLYRELMDKVEGSLVGELSRDSSNIVELVRQQYQAITTSIEIKKNWTSSSSEAYIINKNCGDGMNRIGRSSTEQPECKGIPLGTSVEFELDVMLKECKSHAIVVSPVRLGMLPTLLFVYI